VIVLVSGTPGAGKTYYTSRKIAQAIQDGKMVATNVTLREDWAERIGLAHPLLRFMPRRRHRRVAEWQRRLAYVETVDDLARVRLRTHGFERRLEGRGVAVLDEAGEFLDARAWSDDREQRKRTNRFFQQHRKLGWDIYTIAQQPELVDKQVRELAEYEVRLRNLRRWRLMGVPVSPVNFFLALWSWHGVRSSRPMRKEAFRLSKKIAGIYDTHQIVHEVGTDRGTDGLVWLPRDPATDAATPPPPGTTDEDAKASGDDPSDAA
jgi:zona occludens toxin (predicted ATPase)